MTQIIHYPLPKHFCRSEFLQFHGHSGYAVSEEIHEMTFKKGMLWNGKPLCLEFDFSDESSAQITMVDLIKVDADFQRMLDHFLTATQPIGVFEQHFADHPELGDIIREQNGLAMTTMATPFEALSWAIVSQQVSIKAARSLRKRFVEAVGIRHDTGLFCYPDAKSMLALTVDDLRSAGLSRTKSQTLLDVSQRICAGEICLDISKRDKLIHDLLSVKGIGMWTVNYTLLRGFACLDSSLHGDLAIRKSLALLLDADFVTEKEALAWLEKLQPYRSLAAVHLWKFLNNAVRG